MNIIYCFDSKIMC